MKSVIHHSRTTAVLLGAVLLFVIGSSASADVRLPNVFGNNMVLQQEQDIVVWGWADAGEQVNVSLGENSVTTQPGNEGKWTAKLPALKAGGPHQLTVAGKNTITLENILVGEVWVCSGQSNMEFTVTESHNPQQEIAAAKYPKIRLFHVPKRPAGTPQDDVNARWQPCSPQTIGNFSAVAYFFGRHLHQELGVPIGLIETPFGGSWIEPWIPPVGFQSVPKLKNILQQIAAQNSAHHKSQRDALKRFAQWLPIAQNAAAEGTPIPSPPTLVAGHDLSLTVYSAEGTPIPSPPVWPRHPLASYTAPTGLYNGMVHGIVPFGIRGAIWYQGESNLRDGVAYHEKMQALINGWRSVWKQDDFPFYFVQLAPFRYACGTLLPQVWEAQAAILSTVPNTGMAVITDIGNTVNIHPRNKQEVGRRLALWALAKNYGKDALVYSGPFYKSMKVEGSNVRLSFDHVGAGLASRDGKPLTHFTIAGKDGKFIDARAEIDGDTVVVSSPQVSNPTAVRFGWHEEAEPNLMNKNGLPASPFRTNGLLSTARQ